MEQTEKEKCCASHCHSCCNEASAMPISLNEKQNVFRMIAGAVILITGIVLEKLLQDSYIPFASYYCRVSSAWV